MTPFAPPTEPVPDSYETAPVALPVPPVKKPRRNLRSAKAAGSSFERSIADWLKHRLFDGNLEIDRRVKRGANDMGDISGVRTIRGSDVVIEAKNYGGQFKVGPWLDETERERGNADADIGVVIAKKRGTTDPAEQVVFMTAETFATLLEGGSGL